MKQRHYRPSPATAIAVIALFVALSGVGIAANGGNLILGQSNTATAPTSLTGTTSNPALSITNDGTGLPLRLTGPANVAPLKVSSGIKVTDLNADRLDGLDSTALVSTSVLQRIGPITALPGESPVLLDTGKFALIGVCAVMDEMATVGLQITTSVVHSAFASMYVFRNSASGSATVQSFGVQDMTVAGFTYGLAFSPDVPLVTKVFGTVSGEAVAAGGAQQISFDLYAGQNARGLSGNKCTFGGTVVVK
jgi:hypothetical protein